MWPGDQLEVLNIEAFWRQEWIRKAATVYQHPTCPCQRCKHSRRKYGKRQEVASYWLWRAGTSEQSKWIDRRGRFDGIMSHTEGRRQKIGDVTSIRVYVQSQPTRVPSFFLSPSSLRILPLRKSILLLLSPKRACLADSIARTIQAVALRS
ncbi:hypothetical protein BDN71DRAFT_1096934 [Pleurotus eryngii]|uniref:Uncharacterized protein n=1 Tax=Pleurotus eryngii TaxID=5323 RepID=A0A9P5ZW79_PLEER|nr:hypothetical protein BDN71DRAFT_1096934 [Pleurotus eryngii]